MTEQYAARRKTCEEAAAELGVQNLRQAADQIADASQVMQTKKREALDPCACQAFPTLRK